MYLVTAEEMREMDRQTIESFGIPGRILMENAGRGATRVLHKGFADLVRPLDQRHATVERDLARRHTTPVRQLQPNQSHR